MYVFLAKPSHLVSATILFFPIVPGSPSAISSHVLRSYSHLNLRPISLMIYDPKILIYWNHFSKFFKRRGIQLFTCHDSRFSRSQNDFTFISLEIKMTWNTILLNLNLKAHKTKVYPLGFVLFSDQWVPSFNSAGTLPFIFQMLRR